MQNGPAPSVNLGFVIRWLIAGTTIVAAIALGIYTGSAMISNKPNHPEDFVNRSFLDIGDHFPDLMLEDLETRELVSLSSSMKGQPALIVYVSVGCGACRGMLSYWSRVVLPNLRAEIQVLLILDGPVPADGEQPAEWLLVPRCHLLATLDDDQSDGLGISSTPAVFGIDSNQKIQVVSFGFSRDLTAELINEYIT